MMAQLLNELYHVKCIMYYGHMICVFVYETYDYCVYKLNICCIFTLFAFGKFLLLRHVIYLIYLKLYLNIFIHSCTH